MTTDPVSATTGELRSPAPVASQGIAPQGQLTPQPGRVAGVIGTGEHAQQAIVYTTIMWAFIAGGALSVAALGCRALGYTFPTDEVKGVWAIFGPFITLGLGYIFGKSK